MLLFARVPHLISKKAVSCIWEGQSIMRWYKFPALILLSLRFRGVATTVRNKRFRVILSPIQRQQNRVRTEGRKQSGQRQPEECARGKKPANICSGQSPFLFCCSCSALTRCVGRRSEEGEKYKNGKRQYWWVPSLGDEGGLLSMLGNRRRAGTNAGEKGKTALWLKY